MKILLNFSHADEASEANLHKDKRIINWQPFMYSVYGLKKSGMDASISTLYYYFCCCYCFSFLILFEFEP